MRSALTPEQWGEFQYDASISGKPYEWQLGEEAHVWANNGRAILYIRDGEQVARIKGPEMRHAVAALCLKGQPFGFTREDVNLYSGWWYGEYPDKEQIAQLDDLAYRIEALLPPADAK